MAGLCAPLPTLRQPPREGRRTAWGRCGSIFLHRNGLAPSTPCRSPGALSKLGVLCGTTLLAARRLGESNVVSFECSVYDGRPHLEHEVCSSRRPAHLLFGRHPTMQKPMDRALGLRRRDWLARTPCGGIIDDRGELPGDVSLKMS